MNALPAARVGILLRARSVRPEQCLVPSSTIPHRNMRTRLAILAFFAASTTLAAQGTPTISSSATAACWNGSGNPWGLRRCRVNGDRIVQLATLDRPRRAHD